MKSILFIGFVCFLVSCSSKVYDRETQDTKILAQDIIVEEETQTGESPSFINAEYISFEAQEREYDGIGDDYVLVSDEGYSCENINEVMRFSLSFSIEKEFCGEKEYQDTTIIYFIHYNPPYESLPSLGYKIYLFKEGIGYIDYIDSLYVFEGGALDFNQEFIEGFEYIPNLYTNQLEEISGGELYEFKSKKYGEAYEYIDINLKQDLENNASWIQDNFQIVEDFVERTF